MLQKQSGFASSVLSLKQQVFSCDQNGPSAGEAGRRIGASASGEVRLLFATAIMTRRSRRSWWRFCKRRHAEMPIRFPPATLSIV